MTKQKRVQKPGALYWEPRDGYYQTKVKLHDDLEHPVQINSTLISLTNAKVIYEWLGEALDYLEQEKEK